MNRAEELKVEIEILRKQLGNSIKNNANQEKIFNINIMLDKLIVEYHRLTMCN